MASIPQSPLQTMIQNQVGTQSVAQSGVPSAVNNGNPNTVYNLPQIPMQNAYGQWYLPPTAAPTMPDPWSAAPGSTVQRQTIVWPNPMMPGTGTGGGTPTPGTGGNQQPGTPTGGGMIVPPNFLPNGTAQPQMGNFTPGQPGWESLIRSTGYDPGTPGSDQWNRAAEWSSAVMSRLGGAKDANGNWDWRQIIDMVTEPLFGGNLWLSGTNKWDASNGIASLIQSFTGIPLNNIMNKLGEWQATQDDPADSWLENMLADHWEDNANNDLNVFKDTLNSYMTNYADYKVSGINNATSNYNQSWLDAYTNALSDAMLSGLKGTDATNAAKQAANATASAGGGGAASGGTATGGGRGGGDVELGYGVHEVDIGCVVEDNFIEGYDRADEVQVGDLMIVVDFDTRERKKASVSYAEKVRRPCVRLTSKHGVVLECSIDAEIADEQGNRYLAEDMLGVALPSYIDGEWVDDIVMKVESIGDRNVMKITAENNWYLAGKIKGRYFLHHNVKYYNSYGNRTTASGWQGSGSITPNGLLWGW